MITESQLERQVKITDATRRHFPRPQPVRGLKYFNGEVIWEKPSDSSWNVTSYRLYVDSESNLVREVPVDQTHIGDIISAKRVFVSSYNSNSGLESQKLILNTPVGIGIAIPNKSLLASKFVQSGFNLVDNPGFDAGNNGSWIPTGSFASSPPDLAPSGISTWTIVNDAQGRAGAFTGKHTVGTLTGSGAAGDSMENVSQISCNPGDQFIVSGYAKSLSGATNGTMQLFMVFYDSTGAELSPQYSGSVAGGTTSYQQMIFSAVAPANAVTARIFFFAQNHTVGTWYVDDVSCVPVVGSSSLNIGQLGIGPNGSITLTGFTWSTNGAGTISWTAGFLSYKGVLYSIPAGNTTLQFVYWQLSSPASFQTSALPLPVLGVDDFIVAENNGTQYNTAFNIVRGDGARCVMIGDSVFFLNSNGILMLDIDNAGGHGLIELRNSSGTVTLRLDGSTGIITSNGTNMTVP